MDANKESKRKTAPPLLEVEDLRVSFHTHVGEVQAVRAVSFSLERSRSLGIVGESGCGKSATALSLMRLLPYPGKMMDGRIRYQGDDLLSKSRREMRRIRGSEIAMIFQDPMTSLNPLFTVGNQIVEVIREHHSVSRPEAQRLMLEALRGVGIPSPELRAAQYPYEFSGGMRQRAMIAMALVLKPSLLIADEPTTALDVTIQAQIIKLMKAIRAENQTSILLITHDLGVVADLCDDILVMYAGVAVESGSKRDIYYRTAHPYTLGLLNSLPAFGGGNRKLTPIEGSPPDLIQPPAACPFQPRCRYAFQICREQMPPFFPVGNPDGEATHGCRCWLLHEEAPPCESYLRAKEGARRV